MEKLEIISNFIIWFVVYSIAGWVYEVIICSIEQRHYVDRGFLHGPYCPIYGAGAVVNLLIMGNIDNAAVLFLAGMVTTTTLEYITSVVMEKLFYARWWDYSQMRFNLNGRVCLLGSLVFGAMITLLIKVVHPAVSGITDQIPSMYRNITAAALLIILILDTVFSAMRMSAFNEKLNGLQKKINDALGAYKTRALDLRSAIAKRTKREDEARLNRETSEIFMRMTRFERKIMRVFPRFKSVRYSDALEQLKEKSKDFIISRRKAGKDKN